VLFGPDEAGALKLSFVVLDEQPKKTTRIETQIDGSRMGIDVLPRAICRIVPDRNLTA
jgi:5-bromo-4-chloroindolyl phosphate hydrolysis protein